VKAIDGNPEISAILLACFLVFPSFLQSKGTQGEGKSNDCARGF
jgi:hypothetical protein